MADAPMARQAVLLRQRAGDTDRHLVCRGCGRTEDVDRVAGERPCLEPAGAHGFVIDEAEVIFRGLCPTCRPARTPRTTP